MTNVDSDRPDLTGRAGGAALTRLYDTHARDLHRYLARRLDVVAADDLVGETFLVAWEQRARYDPARGAARAWLFGIATNLLRRHARIEAQTLRALARDAGRAGVVEPEDTASASRVDADRSARSLAGGLSALRAEERDVLLLVAWAGLRPVEIATALDLDVQTVRTRLHRARTKLRECLAREGREAR
ncbi:sigma-70 family RNA polymerase sigma factor [Actinophytocola sp.]|uniref:RNA polymerase sigma factor n=1 Tax=Actinophytocola sp. TaxID=1872138 RepID=UPI002ECFD326